MGNLSRARRKGRQGGGALCGSIKNEDIAKPTNKFDGGGGELDIHTESPTVEKLKRVVRNLKNGKVPGIDQITAEL